MQFIHFSETIAKHFSKVQSESDDRVSKIFRYLRDPSKPQNTRMGVLGNKIADHIETNLNKTGIQSAYSEKFGYFDGYVVDPNKLANTELGNLDGKGPDEIKQYFKETYGVNLQDGEGKRAGMLEVKASDQGYFKQRAMIKAMLTEAGYSRISASVNARVMCKRAGCTLHPMKRLQSKLFKTFDDWLADRNKRVQTGDETITTAAEEDTDQNKTEEERKSSTAEAQAKKAEADSALQDGKQAKEASIKGDSKALGSFREHISAKLGTGAGAAGILCIMHALGQKADELTQEHVVLPLIRMGMEGIAVGDQVKSQQDFDSGLLKNYSQLLNDPKTGSWMNARSIQAEMGRPLTGPDIAEDAKVSNKENFLSRFTNIPGLGTVCKALGSPIGFALSFLGGGLIGNLIGLVADLSGGTAKLMSAVANWIAMSPIDVNVKGADYGNYVNYGARHAANAQSILLGGRELNGTESESIKLAEEQDANNEFKKQNIAYKLFNPYDQKSAISQLIDKQSPNVTQNISSLALSFLNVSHLVGGIFAPKAQAASTATYDYGFPEYGFSEEEMNNSDMENPYQNAAKVVNEILPAHPDYVDKAVKCFGVSLDKNNGYSITSAEENIPIYTKIKGDDCTNSDPDWLRFRFFIFDSYNMESLACYEGEEDSCFIMGLDSTTTGVSPSTDQTSSGQVPSGSSKELANQLVKYVNDGTIKCTTGGCPDIVNSASGQSIKNSSCYVDSLDPNLLGMLLKLAQMNHSFILSALCTDHPSNPSSKHHYGKSADFNTIDGVFMGPNDTSWDQSKINAAKKLDQDITSFMPKSTGFGQLQCHPNFDFLAGFNVFADACHHQHVEIGN